ncbi:hypothetical protein HY604_01375 [Candidatus Peregrinibacteria bacterium]|nr:hypothetical protein [Candidatus Peregrinibacteria bacterium]
MKIRNRKNIFVPFLSALLAFAFVFGGYKIYAATKFDDYFTFTNPEDGFNSIQNDYHAAMNDYFNEKLEAFVDLVDENPEDFFKKADFKAEETCSESNLSSYCVGIFALELYAKYVDTLLILKKDYLAEDSGTTSSEKLQAKEFRDALIEKEIPDAKEIMMATVGIYDEFRLAYPMHNKYETIIKNLRKYQIALKKIRFEVREFPLKLTDATSAECK